MKCRAKVELETVLWTGKNHREMYNFLENKPDNYIEPSGENFYINHDKVKGGLIIKTIEGDKIASIGDYIIKGITGKFFPCNPDIFNETYDIVEVVENNINVANI